MSSGWGSSGFGSGTSGTIVDRSTITEQVTLTGTDISNKYILLGSAPPIGQRAQTALHVSGGTTAFYGEGFQITNDDGGKRLSWDGLTLDGLLQAGDQLVITYPIVVNQ